MRLQWKILLLNWFLNLRVPLTCISFDFSWSEFIWCHLLLFFLSMSTFLSCKTVFVWEISMSEVDSLLITTSNNHHLLDLFFLLKSCISKHCSMLLVTLIEIKLGSGKRRMLRLNLLKSWLWIIVTTAVHNDVLNGSLSHVICTRNVSDNSLNRYRFLAVDFLRSISIYSSNIKSIVIWIKLSLRLFLSILLVFRKFFVILNW